MSMTEAGLQLKQGGAATHPHPLWAEINRVRGLDDILHIQLLDLPLVGCDETRLALRQALQVKRDEFSPVPRIY